MRFRQALKTMDTLTRSELLDLFDRAAYTLAFSSLSTTRKELLDTEASVALMTYLLGLGDLRLSRFVAVFVLWLKKYHGYLNAQKLHKMFLLLEKDVAGGELPLFRLAAYVLKNQDPKKFKNFDVNPLSKPFYLDPRMKELIEKKVREQGFFMGLSREYGLMLPSDAFKERESDLLSEDVLLRRNGQLHGRLLFGVTYRSDAVHCLKSKPDMTAKELSDTLLLSYEPAHRLSNEIKRHFEFGVQSGLTDY